MNASDAGHGAVAGGPGLGSAAPDATGTPAEGPPQNEGLRKATRDFEAVFIQQLVKVMRETVPDSGLVDGGQSEDIFSGLLDEHLSTLTAGEHPSGLADALYRQFVERAE